MSFTFIRNANGPDGSPTVVSFSENDGGDFLIAILAWTAASADSPAAPATLFDTNNNTWNLIFSLLDQGASFASLAVYVSERCVVSGSVNDLDVSELFPGDVIASWANGYEVAAPYASLTQDGNANSLFTYSDNAVGLQNFALSVDSPDSMFLGAAFDAALADSNVSEIISVPSAQPATPVLNVFDGGTGSSNPGSNLYAFGFLTTVAGAIWREAMNNATAMFGFGIGLSGSNVNPNAGGNAQTLVFTTNKGPEPITPKEGRVITTVQIDCSQQAVQLICNFPEFCLMTPAAINNAGLEGFTILDFDLMHINQGSGLSEVRTLMYWARPQFGLDAVDSTQNREDEGLETGYAAMITNTTTLQTISLGELADTFQMQGRPSGQWGIVSFPANKHSLKYRFICPQQLATRPIGKFTLQFCNFEVPPSSMSIGAVFGASND